jgi:alkylation response protein AidB-like acyl-CoA dehydrogenase
VSLPAPAVGGRFVLDGTKATVEGAPDADIFLVAAATGTGVTQFLVPATTPGLVVEPLESLDLSRRFGQVTFSNVELDTDAVLGSVGEGGPSLERQLEVALVLQCAESVGCMAAVFDFTLEWAFDRYSFGRPLASYQELKHRFADMKLWLEASNATTTAAAEAVDDHASDVTQLVSVAKAYVGDHSLELGHDCVQMHGGIGVTWEHDIHLSLRRLTQNWGLFGTPDEHRARLVERLAAV